MKVLDSMEIPATEGGRIFDIGERVTMLADRLVVERRSRLELEDANRSLARTRDLALEGRLAVAGQRWGKTEAMREKIREDAATPEDAEAAIRELESTGRAFMNGAGQHVGTQGGEPSDERPPTDDAEGEPEDGPFSGLLQIRIGPDGYPWIGVLGLIELMEDLGTAAYRDEEVAEPGPEEADLEGEIDPDVPLWRVEVSRAFDHLLNAARVGFRV